MPLMSDTMEEGVIAAWHKNIGEEVESGEILAEIETDKATMELESYFDGVLLYAAGKEGDAVKVADLLVIIGEKDENVEAIIAEYKASKGSSESSKSSEIKEETQETSTSAASANETISTQSNDQRIKASPLAKAMAKEHRLDLSTIKGTGDDNRIVKRDIENALKSGGASTSITHTAPKNVPVASPVGTYEDVRVSQMRKTIARRLGESKFTAPHFYLNISINMDAAIQARKKINEIAPNKVSFNDMIVKAAAVALKKHPKVNASWFGDFIRYYTYVNIGVAVAVEDGLVVPVIQNADQKGFSEIAKEVREYAGQAHEKTLALEKMEGSTFTISNLGMFGIEDFTAIINPPDACIMAVGSIKKEAIVGENDELKVASMMRVTLSCDHRVVDGALGAQFLQTFKSLLEDPIRILI